jgi:hypothetical protein
MTQKEATAWQQQANESFSFKAKQILYSTHYQLYDWKILSNRNRNTNRNSNSIIIRQQQQQQ